MTTKYETPVYHKGVFYDELRESAPTGERKQVYLLNGNVVALGEIKEYQDRSDTFLDGGITLSVRGEKTKDIQHLLATDKDYKKLADGAPVHKHGLPSCENVVVGFEALLEMESYLLSFKGTVPLTEEDRYEVNLMLTQAANIIEKHNGNKQISDYLRYVSRRAIEQIVAKRKGE